MLNVHTRSRRIFTERDVVLLTAIGSLFAGAVHQARLHRRLAAREHALEQFAERVIAAQEAERRRLAGDIHDGISQRLISLSYHLDAAADALHELPEFTAEQLVLARQMIDLTLNEARAAISGLRPPVLDDLGLADGLASLARSIGGVQVTVEADECTLPEHVEIALYRIAQEALQNVVKHAGASAASVVLRRDPGLVSRQPRQPRPPGRRRARRPLTSPPRPPSRPMRGLSPRPPPPCPKACHLVSNARLWQRHRWNIAVV